MSKSYEIMLDIFLMQGYSVEADTEQEAIEKAKDLANGDYPSAEVTLFEVQE